MAASRRALRTALGTLLVLGAQAPMNAGAGTPAPSSHLAAGPIQGVDSMWVWQSRPAGDLAASAKSLDVSRVFLFVGNPDHATDRNLKQSVQLLHAEGIEVHALSGDPHWTTQHKPALAWARRALRLAPFDGLHLDVEPHALKNWKHDQQRLVADYLVLMDKLGALRGPLEVDAQFAYGRIATPGGSTFADDILDRVDAVTVMSYRDTADGANGMVAIAKDWLERATRAAKPIRLAAETNELADCPYCTFYEEGQARMADVLTGIDVLERADYPTYQGFAIEDLDGWLALGP